MHGEWEILGDRHDIFEELFSKVSGMRQLPCVPASLTSILPLNKYLSVEYMVSRGRWNLARTRLPRGHLEPVS